MHDPRKRSPVEHHSDGLPESCREYWAGLLAARRKARREGNKLEADRIFQFGLGFVKALYLTEEITIAARDDLRGDLISA